MDTRVLPRWAWVALTAALAMGAAACGSASLDKAGGPVSRPVVLTLANAAGGSPDAVTCPAASAGGVAATASALRGTWQVTYTENELIASGADPSELQPG